MSHLRQNFRGAAIVASKVRNDNYDHFWSRILAQIHISIYHKWEYHNVRRENDAKLLAQEHTQAKKMAQLRCNEDKMGQLSDGLCGTEC